MLSRSLSTLISQCFCRFVLVQLRIAKRQFASLCGRDTVQYENPNISQEILETFLTPQYLPIDVILI